MVGLGFGGCALAFVDGLDNAVKNQADGTDGVVVAGNREVDFLTYWKEKWEAWFNEYTSINTAEMADWKQKSETEFRDWFEQLQALLDGNTAASLAKKLLELQEQVDILNQFSSNLENEYTVYQKLYDNGYRTYGDVLDSSEIGRASCRERV